MDKTQQLLQELTDAHGVPGYEAEVRAVARRYLEPLGVIEQDLFQHLTIGAANRSAQRRDDGGGISVGPGQHQRLENSAPGAAVALRRFTPGLVDDDQRGEPGKDGADAEDRPSRARTISGVSMVTLPAASKGQASLEIATCSKT